MSIRFLLILSISTCCFGSLKESHETVSGRETIIHTRDGDMISRKFLNSEGKATIQHLYFENEEVFVIANDYAVNNVYHKMIGKDGIQIMKYEVDSRRKVTIGNPEEGKMGVFVFQKDGFVEPVSDDELSHHIYIPLNGECIEIPNEKLGEQGSGGNADKRSPL